MEKVTGGGRRALRRTDGLWMERGIRLDLRTRRRGLGRSELVGRLGDALHQLLLLLAVRLFHLSGMRLLLFVERFVVGEVITLRRGTKREARRAQLREVHAQPARHLFVLVQLLAEQVIDDLLVVLHDEGVAEVVELLVQCALQAGEVPRVQRPVKPHEQVACDQLVEVLVRELERVQPLVDVGRD